MDKPKSIIPAIIIVNALIWGFAMIMSSRALSGTDTYEQIQHILSGGAAISLLVVGGGLSSLAKKLKSNEQADKET